MRGSRKALGNGRLTKSFAFCHSERREASLFGLDERTERFFASLRMTKGKSSAAASESLIFGITNRLEVAFSAFRFARLADPAAVPDQLVREQNPSVARNRGHQILLDFLRIGVAGEIEP